MAGFAVGVVDRKKMIDGSKIKEGNVVIGISSSGIHSNGYSLVRKLFFDKLEMSPDDKINELGTTLGDALIAPTKIYAKACNAVFEKCEVNGIVHITGGGFYENIPRIIPEGLGVNIRLGSWRILPIFQYIKQNGNIELKEMFSTFNMGIGMMMVVDEEKKDTVLTALQKAGEKAEVIGEIVKGQGVSII